MFSALLIWLPPIVIGLALAGLIAYIWPRRTVPGAKPLMLTLACIAMWCLTAGFEYRCTTLIGHLRWCHVQIVSIVLSPVCFLLTSLHYVGRTLGRRKIAALCIVPTVTVAIHWTSRWNNLYWQHVWLDYSAPIPLLARVYGREFWAHMAYNYSLLGLSAFLVAVYAVRNPPQRRPACVYLGSMLVPLFVGTLYIFDVAPTRYLDITPYGFSVSVVAIAWVMLRGRFRTVLPVAWGLVVESMREGVIVLDNDDRLLDLNPAARALLGKPSQELIGYPAKDAFASCPTLIPPVLANQPQTEVCIPEGSRKRAYSLSAQPIESRGFTLGRLLTLRDVTVQYQATQHLEAARRAAEEASATKSRFLAVMSHEIRTPMNGVLGMSDVLQRTALTPEQSEIVNVIQEAAQSLVVIVDDILDFSRIGSGKLPIERIPFNLETLTKNVVSLLRSTAASKQLTVGLRMEPDVPRHLVGDPVRIRQVLVNLLGNAVKFTGQGGSVTILATCRAIESSDVHLVLAVADTGIGIEKDQLPLIFQEFTQADSSISRKHGGTGLGLAIVRGLVKKMGGTIRVESEVGIGSTFFVELRLPMAAKPVETSEEPEEPRQSLFPGCRVLLAEDNEINQKVCERMLSNLGCQTDLAADGREAVRLASEHAYQVIFMDFNMPELSGPEATVEIRRRDVRTPIVALTASVLEETRQACRVAGMNDFITKPFRQSALVACLAKWVPSAAADAPPAQTGQPDNSTPAR
jgi:signal transduction histidine kinase/ActR/RegA family two-component response regulator